MNHLQIIHGDVMKVQLPFFDVCVANLPYQVMLKCVIVMVHDRVRYLIVLCTDFVAVCLQAAGAPPDVPLRSHHVPRGVRQAPECQVRSLAGRCGCVWFRELTSCGIVVRPGDELYCRLSVNTQLLAKVDQLLKVGRNNFRPPPKVESRVVRIEPRNPPPPVNFTVRSMSRLLLLLFCAGMRVGDLIAMCHELGQEWDGMIKIVFNRKNKTLNSCFTTKSVLSVLEENYKTFCSLNNEVRPSILGSLLAIHKLIILCDWSASGQ